jgi:UDP-N-acetyl-D-mannosaminuronic acid dehydrogenase
VLGPCGKGGTRIVSSLSLDEVKMLASRMALKNAAAKHLLKSGVKPKIAILGLAFKPDIDDLRESRALEVAETLLFEGYTIYVVEPNIQSHKKFLISNLMNAIEHSDIICVLVKHREFLNPEIKEKLLKSNTLDFCGCFLNE